MMLGLQREGSLEEQRLAASQCRLWLERFVTRSNSVPTLFEVRRLHARVDFNGSGALDLAEFVRFMPAGF